MARAPYVSFPVVAASPGRRPAANDIVASFLEQQRSGRLPAGCRLPPVRVLEQQLGLSKNTAQSAYDELVARGAIEARAREGVFVAMPDRAVNETRLDPMFDVPLPKLRTVPGLHRAAPPPRDLLSLSTVFIDPALLPRERIADCIRSVLKSPGIDAFYDPQGYPPLREAIATRLRARGMHDAQADNVIVTMGSQQAIDLVFRALAAPRIAIENPVYSHVRSLIAAQGASAIPLAVDPFRPLPLDAWEAQIAAQRPTLMYSITSFQNPTGYSYSTQELMRVLELSARHGFALLEDDWGSDMLSGSEYRPSLRVLGGANVVYINSFTKKLLPSLRLGFLVAHTSLVPTLVALKRVSMLGNPWILEAALSEFLDRGYYDTHLAQVQHELDARYLGCLEALREFMPRDVRWTTPGGGPTLWLDLPRTVDLRELQERLLAHKIAVETTDAHFDGAPHLHGFRISYAFVSSDVLRGAIQMVANEIRRQLPTG